MSDDRPAIPRFVPERPLPPYSYVPGWFPHPISDAEGHSHGIRHEAVAPLDPERWHENRDYLQGIDLFNHGYYWEAHEAWEGLWHACGRSGVLGDFLKGLIQMTAAGVKVRQGVPTGVQHLGEGAAELFRKTIAALGGRQVSYLGLDLGQLLRFVEEVANNPQRGPGTPQGPVEIVFSLVLSPVR